MKVGLNVLTVCAKALKSPFTSDTLSQMSCLPSGRSLICQRRGSVEQFQRKPRRSWASLALVRLPCRGRSGQQQLQCSVAFVVKHSIAVLAFVVNIFFGFCCFCCFSLFSVAFLAQKKPAIYAGFFEREEL